MNEYPAEIVPEPDNIVGNALIQLLPTLKAEELRELTVVMRSAVNIETFGERRLLAALNDLYEACVDEADRRRNAQAAEEVMRATEGGNKPH